MSSTQKPRNLPDRARELAEQARRYRVDRPPFEAAQAVARAAGGLWHDDHATVGYWVPHLVRRGVPEQAIQLEVLVLPPETDLSRHEQELEVERHMLPVVLADDHVWAAFDGVEPGTRSRVGPLYRLVWTETAVDGRLHRHHMLDPLAASLPFGVNAPAELYDTASMHAQRGDETWWHRPEVAGGQRVPPPTNILQLHVPTATAEGTVGALAEKFLELGRAQRAGEPLTPELALLAGYDALQPLPLEPTVEYEIGPRFVHRLDDGDDDAPVQRLRLRRPDMTNWGYDIVLAGSGATNPRLLGSGRPDELVDLSVALHTLPEPMLLVIDVVYGHTDNQALPLLDPIWFRGPNMYGQDVNQQHPGVRAHVLEMQRRKVDHGADGVRVDGAQDFTTWDAAQNVVAHDDDFLALMADVPQEVCGVAYRPWFVFEDGRPWPREDWPVASTYRAVIDQQPHAFQWGPITFAHNTPALQGFWQERWWRVEQILTIGSNWISGCANHDTVRRGTQIPLDAAVNPALGSSRPEVLANAYDNAAAQLLTYAVFPGVPMDFLNATARAPWAFVRNTDDRYGVKVVAEEALFLWWQLDERRWERLEALPRLRALGIRDLDDARHTFASVATAVEAAGDDLVGAAERLAALDPAPSGLDGDVTGLKRLARAYMDDVEELCRVHRSLVDLDADRLDFAVAVRQFRRRRSWLREDVGDRDRWGRDESGGALLVHVLRHAPDDREQVLAVLNLAGTPVEVVPVRAVEEDAAGWQVALTSPGLATAAPEEPWTLADSEGLVLVRGTRG